MARKTNTKKAAAAAGEAKPKAEKAPRAKRATKARTLPTGTRKEGPVPMSVPCRCRGMPDDHNPKVCCCVLF